MRVSGSVALVTGGASGIGRSICEALLNAGAKVCFVDLNGETGAKTEGELKTAFPGSDIMFEQRDVTNRDDFAEAYNRAEARYGKVDIMVNNAGMVSESQWSLMIDVNIKGVFNGTYIALENMGKNKGGKGGVIINISSIGALFPSPFLPVYAASKAAILHFTLSWADEVQHMEHGVRLTALCPHFVETALAADCFKESYLLETFSGSYDMHPQMPTSRVSDAVLRVVEDDMENGKILVIVPEEDFYHEMAPLKEIGAFKKNQSS